MAKMTARTRNNLPDSAFAGPGRTYPIPDKTHAAVALGRATQQENKGNLSKTAADRIRAKARAKLKRASG